MPLKRGGWVVVVDVVVCVGGGWGSEDITATAILSFKNGLGSSNKKVRTEFHSKTTRGRTDTLWHLSCNDDAEPRNTQGERKAQILWYLSGRNPSLAQLKTDLCCPHFTRCYDWYFVLHHTVQYFMFLYIYIYECVGPNISHHPKWVRIRKRPTVSVVYVL